MSSHANSPRHPHAKRRGAKRCRALLICLALLIPPLLITTRCGADDARAADERCTAIAVHLASALRAGDITTDLYAELSACRREAQRAVTVWLHTGWREHEAKACLAVLELAVERLRGGE